MIRNLKNFQKTLKKAATELNFEEAARLRDKLLEVRKILFDRE